jgi:hypothetical protein
LLQLKATIMKKTILHYSRQSKIRLFFLFAGFVALFFSSGSNAQTDSTANKDTVAELISPTVQFTSIQKSDNSVELKVSIKAKSSGNIVRPSGVTTSFFLVTDSGETELGKAKTDIAGMARIQVKKTSLLVNKEGKLHFKCQTDPTKKIEAGEEELSVKIGHLVLAANKQDSTQSLSLKLVDLSTGSEKPMVETDLAIYVKRMINPLKIAEGKTDSSGEAEIEIPSKLPGDSKGNIELIARLDDNEDYGTLEASTVQTWGTKVSDTVSDLPRSLFSTHPPIWMLVTFIILVTVVWGHYIVIIYELFRLRKEH